MKLRIQDNSVRFRITLKELEELSSNGAISCETHVAAPANESLFRYEVRRTYDQAQSALAITPFGFTLSLNDADCAELIGETSEGVYIKDEWTGADGLACRSMVFIEKDRPGATCTKPEAWIYDMNPGGIPVTRPILLGQKAKAS